MSKLEDQVVNILFREKIPYEREKTYTELRAGRFRYDFYLPTKNCIIEVNGQQHYEPVWGIQKFRLGQEHDRRKISFALANSIPIYCIPYWDIQNLQRSADLFKPQYLAKTRWHNDEVWELHKKNRGKL